MALKEYYLRIERFTQNRYSGDPEVAVNPDSIDAEKNLHVYLTGVISPDLSVELRVKRLTFVVDNTPSKPGPKAAAAQSYKASLPHYTLATGTTYLLKAVDSDQDPWAITSHEVKTL